MLEEEEEEELLPHTTIGHYEIHRRIGAGGMGDVYAAEHKALGKRVAIKVLRRRFLEDESVVARFIREGQLAARIRHPNIVDVTDSAVIDDVPCLVMELLEGEPLIDKIDREGGIEVEELVDLALPIVAALDHAHGEGVLHRDLKPGNVFLARGWSGELIPKLLDFGISKSIGDSMTSALTSATGFLGTPRYAAPEIIEGGTHRSDARSDQYSFALILYEAVTGEKPFAEIGAAGLVALARAIASGHTKRLRDIKPEIPEAFERVVRRAMAVLPADRFSSMQAFGAALLPFASQRVRLIWEPIFGKADPLTNTAATNVALEAESPRSGVAKLDEDPAPSQGTVVLPGATPRGRSNMGHTAVLPRPFSTPRDSSVSLPSQTGAFAIRHAPPAPPASSRFPFGAAVVGALALLGAALISVNIVRSAQPVPSASAAAPVPAPEAASTFEVRIQVTPESAYVLVDGTPMGTGALVRSFPRNGQRHTLHAFAAGHESATLEFDEANPPPPVLTLHEVSAVARRPGAAPVAPVAPATGATTGARGGARPGTRTDNIDPWKP